MGDLFSDINGVVHENYSTSKLNTWKIGGLTKYYIKPSNIEDIMKVKKICTDNNISLFTLGNGSNLLIEDSVFNGVILHVGRILKDIIITDYFIEVGAGMDLPKLAYTAAKENLTGFEFYAGIPGTVGGAIVMNAGCLGKETSEILDSVKYINKYGDIIEEKAKKLELSFRNSKFRNLDHIIISAKFKKNQLLNNEGILEDTKKATNIRKAKFPVAVRTAGSTFKSAPDGPYPGELVEAVGLKGFRVGDAHISEVHGNWIINDGQAKAADVKALMTLMQDKVKEKFDITMELEVLILK